MEQSPLGIGIVGAGANTRARHIPGFRQLDGVEIVGVVNSTPESTARVAQEFGIPRTYPSWQSLVDDPNIDAVMLGTWPNLHCEVTCAALESGKHVLTEARMARNASEAHRMLATAKKHSNLVAQVVPSPFGLVQNEAVRELIANGYLGELRELVVIGAADTFWDVNQPLHWRQDRDISGMNILSLGILHESAMRWTPPTTRVLAQATIFQPHRQPSPPLGKSEATVPDSVQIVTQLEGGARGLYHIGGLNLFGPGNQIHLYGSRGTLRFEMTPVERLLIGSAGQSSLHEMEIPEEKRGGWRVEAEFVGAIRGQEQVRLTDFATGVKYMEFTEAVTRSASRDLPVELPLTDIN
jgi:predicted dehydrogenase